MWFKIGVDIRKEVFMKIIFDENDKICAKKYADKKYPMLFPENGAYSLNFVISDIGKANMFLSQLLGKKDIVEIIEKEGGLRITSMNLYPAISTGFVKEQLKNAIEQIESEEQRIT